MPDLSAESQPPSFARPIGGGSGGLRSRRARIVASCFVLAVGSIVALAFAALTFGDPQAGAGDPGRLEETVRELPPDVPLPSLEDASLVWGLENRQAIDSASPMAGGLAVGDIDNDGDLDLVVAHGTVDLYRWDGERFDQPLSFGEDALAVSVFDVDADGWMELLVARSSATDLVIWGGEWARNSSPPTNILELAGSAPTAALMAADLSGDGRTDLLALGRGVGTGEPDIMWLADPARPRTFEATPLGDDSRLSLAAEFVDVDNDGLVDVWVTRDVGWIAGPDSLYSRQGLPDGPWSDIAPAFGSDLAIDGMGVTMADLNGDLLLDAYVSDLGDNEVLLRDGDAFTVAADTGAARIRPPGAGLGVISSSWASGAVDLNLDGRLDLVVSSGGFSRGGMKNKIAGTTIAVDDAPAVLLGIGQGRFVDAWPDLGLPAGGSGRGLTVADFDRDGDDDVVLITADGRLQALENTTLGDTITVSPKPGCDATGAVVSIETPDRTFTTLLRSHTFGGGHSPETIVGWPNKGTAIITVSWLDGSVTGMKVVGPSSRQSIIVNC